VRQDFTIYLLALEYIEIRSTNFFLLHEFEKFN
jgi:hypothetical protein